MIRIKMPRVPDVGQVWGGGGGGRLAPEQKRGCCGRWKRAPFHYNTSVGKFLNK